jgi:hypothetical protein
MFVLQLNTTQMQVYNLDKDRKIFCVRAEFFPFHIKEAFAELIHKIPSTDGRTFFGISYQDKSGDIIYKAAVEESFDGEGRTLGFESFLIKKGEYLVETVKDWKKDESIIGTTFRRLTNTEFDCTFPCVEWYQGQDVICMVRLSQS